MGKQLLQSERNANLLIDVLRSLVGERHFELADFVVMPDHVHLLITIRGEMTIEKAMQLIKGRFSYRLKKERGFIGEVWQRGFSEERADNQRSIEKCREYIGQNPVKAGLASRPDEFPFCYGYMSKKKAGRG